MLEVPAPRTYRAPVSKPIENANGTLAHLCVRGIRKRCRKPDFHMEKIDRYSYPMSETEKLEAQRIALHKFREHFKAATEAFVSYTPVQDSDGIQSHSVFSVVNEPLTAQ